MKIGKITSRFAVFEAIDKYNELGEEEFLSRYEFGPAREFFLVYKGKYYPSKAILGVAFGYQFPQFGPLKSRDFVGGEQVKRILERLGFSVQIKLQ